jgi:hypothetical protein
MCRIKNGSAKLLIFFRVQSYQKVAIHSYIYIYIQRYFRYIEDTPEKKWILLGSWWILVGFLGVTLPLGALYA